MHIHYTNLRTASKAELQDIRRNKRVEGMAVRSRAKWLKDGEKVSRYFCVLESRNFTDKFMSFFERENGDIVNEQKAILEEVKLFL